MNQLFDGRALFVRALLIGLWRQGYGAGFYASEPHPHGLRAASTDGGVEELESVDGKSGVVGVGRMDLQSVQKD